MGQKAKLFQTSLSQGEVSEEIEARPDLGKRFNGVRVMENFWALPEGGAFRRPGTQFVCEVKNSAFFTMLIPFEATVSDAFVIEVGQGYFRFIKNGERVLVGGIGPIYQVSSPFQLNDLRDLHYEQSRDFQFFCSPNPAYDIQKLARLADDNWVLADFNADPPPSFDADENLSVPGALAANSGNGVKFRTNSDQFLAGDEGRQIVGGIGRAVITAIDDPRQVTVDILDPFAQTITEAPNTLLSTGTTVTSMAHGAEIGNAVLLTSGAQLGEIRIIVAVPTIDTLEIDDGFSVNQGAGHTWKKIVGFSAGAWFLRLAPQATLNVNTKKEPVGTNVNLVMGVASLRASYVGKFIKVLGGTVEITEVSSTTAGKGIIRSILFDSSTSNPPLVEAGAWRLQEASWSATRGRPRTICIHQGRLLFASTKTQPKTFWAHSLNDIFNFATGSLATDAYEYTIAGGARDPIEWLVSLVSLYIGDSKQEYSGRGQGPDVPLGGDEVPFVSKIATAGSLHVQPAIVDNAILLTQRFARDVVTLAYSLQESADATSFVPGEATLFARQISDMGFAKHPPAYQQKPNSIIFYPLVNGQLAGLTFKPRQEILAWARTVTEGTIESVAVVPHEDGKRQTIYCIVQRMINFQVKRFIEFFEDDSPQMSQRRWRGLNLDCAVVGTDPTGLETTIGGLSHLEGASVYAVIHPIDFVGGIYEGDFSGPYTVIGGEIIIEEQDGPYAYEVGLMYNSTLTTLRPSIPNEVTEGFKRSWPQVFVRLKNTIGGKLNGKPLKPTGTDRFFTGLARMENVQTADPYDGALTITQDQPYPLTCLGISGKVAFGDEMA